MPANALTPNKARKRPVRKTAKFFCRFDEDEAAEIDAAADRLVITRSELIRTGTLRYVRTLAA